MKKKLPPEKLEMSFDPNTIEHLGIKMYSSLPTAIAELIANSYDADSSQVKISLNNSNNRNEIVIKDDGIGMSFSDINNFFLKIGRNRRKEGYIESPGGRKATGKKGLGKLAFFGIGDTIIVSTIKKRSGIKTEFVLDWNDLITTKGKPYEPTYTSKKCSSALHGTEIKLTNLKLKTNFDTKELAIGVSKLFNFIDNSFKVRIIQNNNKAFDVDNKLKYSSITPEFNWSFPGNKKFLDGNYPYSKNFKGSLISTEKPLKPDLRGVTLYANGRLINAPEFFGASESSHFFSYLTGWLEIDFVDDWKEDVISTNRQALNWDLERTKKLRDVLKRCLNKLEIEWRKRRNERRQKIIREKTKIDIENWYKTLPKEVLNKIKPLVDIIIDQSELSEGIQSVVINDIHYLVPEYPNYHWRHLHNSIQKVSQIDYQNKDYLRAAFEAVKNYVIEVQKKSEAVDKLGKPLDGNDLMFNAFGEKGLLKITNCLSETEKNIERGQQHISAGIVSGFRNPVSHEVKQAIHPKYFSDKDCLDILSVLSYLFGNLILQKNNLILFKYYLIFYVKPI